MDVVFEYLQMREKIFRDRVQDSKKNKKTTETLENDEYNIIPAHTNIYDTVEAN